jgi:hypothetical protein
MPTDRKYSDRLEGYTEVKDRIPMFYERYPDGRLVTTKVKVTDAPDGTPRVWVQAKAYRTPDDTHPGVGWSWMVLPGSTPYTKGSELENTETSAWGRAIGSLNIGIGAGFASKDELNAKSGEGARETTERDKAEETVNLIGDIDRRGTVRKGDGRHSDLQFRETPDGHAVGFRLEVGKDASIPQVFADGAIGRALFLAVGEDVSKFVGTHVHVWGRLYQVRQPGRRAIYRLLLSRIKTDEWIIPAEPERMEQITPQSINRAEFGLDPEPEPVAPGQETLPLTDDEKAAIAGSLG